MRRSSLLVAGLAALFVVGLLAGCGAFPSAGWSPYVPTSGETVDPSVATLVFTFTGGTGGTP